MCFCFVTLCKNLNVCSSVTDTDASNKAVVDAQPTQDEHSTTAASAMVNQDGLTSEATQAVVAKTKGVVSTSDQQEPAQSNIPQTICAYGRQQECVDLSLGIYRLTPCRGHPYLCET
jgi:hypothetical protein